MNRELLHVFLLIAGVVIIACAAVGYFEGVKTAVSLFKMFLTIIGIETVGIALGNL